jgi:hypothetical protein
MIDSLIIATLATSISSILVAVYTHVKHSECCGGFKLDTYSPSELQPQPQIIISQPATPHNTPELKHSNQTSV